MAECEQSLAASTSFVVPPRLFLEGGLLPFQDAREFSLHAEENAPPFLVMTCPNVAVPQQPRRFMKLTYVLIDPFDVFRDYAPDIAESDLAEVGLVPGQKPLILAIVNLRLGVEAATANLVGPLLINPVTGKTKQIVLQNATRYSARQRLLNGTIDP